MMIMMKKGSAFNTYGLISFGLLSTSSSHLNLSFSSIISLASVSAILSSSISSNNFSFARSLVIVFNSARCRVNKLNMNIGKKILSYKTISYQERKKKERNAQLSVLYYPAYT